MWPDFSGFLSAYDAVAAVVQNADDLEEVAFSYLAATAAAGTIYVEFMLSPPDLLRNGISYPDQLAALTAAWERSRSQFGIESRLIVTCVRHLGPEAALQAALLASSFTHPYVVGFGLTGDERQFEIGDFAPAFRLARDAGLRLTAHAGEHRGAPSIREAVQCLGLDRVGHGIRAPEDPSVMSFLAEGQIGLEICVSSNLALGLYRRPSSSADRCSRYSGVSRNRRSRLFQHLTSSGVRSGSQDLPARPIWPGESFQRRY